MSTHHKLFFALANTAAVFGSLYIAFALDLERPYWAMFTVFIVANPIAGAVRSKAVYRFVGTFVGACIALLMVPPLADAPVLLCLAMSLWVGTCLYFSLLERTPRSYLFLLAGYTAAIVGLSVVDSPQAIFNTTVSRIEEISLGLICATIAHSVVFPRNVSAELNRKIQATLAGAANWFSDELLHLDRPADLHAQERLATFVTDLQLLYTHVAFETSDVPRAGGVMRVLQDRLALLLPRISSVQKAVTALAANGQVPDSVTTALEATSRWMRGEVPTPASSQQSAVPVAIVATAPLNSLETSNDWPRLLEKNALANLRELTVAFADCRLFAAKLLDQRTPLPAQLSRETDASGGRRPLHRDRGLALLSAFAAAGATLVACLMWIQGAWPEGGVAAQFAAIGCSLAATLDQPAKFIRSAIIGILMALPLAALFEFAILPQIDGFASLALVLSPAIVLFSLMQSSAQLGGAGLVLAIAFSGGLALQSTYQASFAAFVNSNLAEVAGLLVAVAMSLIFRTIMPAWNARRISRAGQRAVCRLATQRKVDLDAWTSEMFDRLGLVTSRIGAAEDARLAVKEIDVLRDLRVGLNIGTLRYIREGLSSVTRAAVLEVLNAASRIYGGTSRDRQANIEVSIGRAITFLETEQPSQATRDGLAALTGLRLDLARVGTHDMEPHIL